MAILASGVASVAEPDKCACTNSESPQPRDPRTSVFTMFRWQCWLFWRWETLEWHALVCWAAWSDCANGLCFHVTLCFWSVWLCSPWFMPQFSVCWMFSISSVLSLSLLVWWLCCLVHMSLAHGIATSGNEQFKTPFWNHKGSVLSFSTFAAHPWHWCWQFGHAGSGRLGMQHVTDHQLPAVEWMWLCWHQGWWSDHVGCYQWGFETARCESTEPHCHCMAIFCRPLVGVRRSVQSQWKQAMVVSVSCWHAKAAASCSIDSGHANG